MIKHVMEVPGGVPIHYAFSEPPSEKPALLFVLPFGLRLDLAQPVFSRFKDSYRVICWEARLILAPEEQPVNSPDLTVEHHVADLFAVLDVCEVVQANVIGYCSGAGIALAAANLNPERINALVLVSGEYTLLDKPACVTQSGRDIDSLLPMASKDRKTAQFILDRMPIERTPINGRPVPEGLDVPFSQIHYFYRYSLNYVSYRSVDFENLARSISNRTLLIACQRDLQSNVDSTMQIKKLISGASLFVDPEGDHYEVLRTQSRVMSVISQFLEGDCDRASEHPLQHVDTACV